MPPKRLPRSLTCSSSECGGKLQAAPPDVTVDRAAVRALLADLVSHGLLAAM